MPDGAALIWPTSRTNLVGGVALRLSGLQVALTL